MLSTLGAPRSAQRTGLRQHAKRLTVAGACGNSAAPMFGRCCLTDHAVGPEGFQMGLFCLSRSEFQRWHLSYLKHAPQDMISKQAICLGGELVVLVAGFQLTHLWYVQDFATPKQIVCLLSGALRKKNVILTQRHTRLADLTATSTSAAGSRRFILRDVLTMQSTPGAPRSAQRLRSLTPAML